MKIKPTRSPRAFIALLPTLTLVSPAFAQDAPAQTAPPAPVEQSAPAPTAPAPAPVFAPSAPVVQAVPDYTRATAPPAVETAPDAPAINAPTRRTTATRAAPSTRMTAAVPRTTTPTPVAAPIVDTPAPTPAAVTQGPPAAAAAPVAPTNAAAPVPATTRSDTRTDTQKSTFAIWPWIVGAGVVLLGLIALLASRRRREDVAVYEEPIYQEPVATRLDPVVAPIVAAPVTAAPVEAHTPQLLRPAVATDPVAAPAPVPAEETQIVDADQADVAALTEGHAPVANRPWLEFGMRPIRAGTTSDEALVEIELTVGNAGSVAADNVRISTFLFASEPADAAEFEKLLVEHGADASADPVTIAAGEGTRVDATLALPKADLAALFNPVIVADARYRLPDGSEGRTFASFSIGMIQENGALGAMENNRPSMHEDIEARLYGTPQHV